MRKRTAVIAAVTVLAIGGGVAYAAWSSSGSGSGSVASTTSANSTISPVAGAVGLYPGHTVSFQVTINNPNDYPVTVTRKVRVTNPNNLDIKVTRLDTLVGRPSPNCPANAVTVDALAAPVLVAKNASADVNLTVRMARTAPDTCKNLVFPLTYSGTAIKP